MKRLQQKLLEAALAALGWLGAAQFPPKVSLEGERGRFLLLDLERRGEVYLACPYNNFSIINSSGFSSPPAIQHGTWGSETAPNG